MLTFRQTLYIVALALALLTGSCATFRDTTNQPDRAWLIRQQALQGFAQIACTARTSVTTKVQQWHFTLDWQQQGERFIGNGYSLLGNQLFSLHGNAHTTSFTRAGRQPVAQPSTAAITASTGLDFSPAVLFSLIVAIAHPHADATYTQGRLTNQVLPGGASVEYLDYQQYQGLLMPRRLRISKDNTRMAMSFSSWQLGDASPADSLQ